MKLLIDNIKRTIIFKENKAFYKNKKEEVDITLFFKKSKDGISVLRKKYSHMLVSEDDRNILFGGGGTDLLKIELKKNDKEDTSKLFRKIIALYLMAEMYTNKDILDRRIDNIAATEKASIKEIADDPIRGRRPPPVAAAVVTSIDNFITRYNLAQVAQNVIDIQELTDAITKKINTINGLTTFGEETKTTDENKEITKWVQVKYLLKDFKEYIETNTTTIDTIFTLLTSARSQRNIVGGAKLSSLTPSLLLKGNPGAAPPAAAGRRNGNLLIQSTGIGVNGVGAAAAPGAPGGAGAAAAAAAVAAAAAAAAAAAVAAAGAGAAADQIKEYKEICKIFKDCYEYINYLKSLYSAYDTYAKVDKTITKDRIYPEFLSKHIIFKEWMGRVGTQYDGETDALTKKKKKTATKQIKSLTTAQVENNVKATGVNIQAHIETYFNRFQEKLIRDNDNTTVNNILYYLALISKEYKSLFDYDKYPYRLNTAIAVKWNNEITAVLRKINVIENIITEYFRVLINEKKAAIFSDAAFITEYTEIKHSIPKNYINSSMLDDIYLEKLVNYNDINTKTETHPGFTTQLKQAAAKISTILHLVEN